MLVANDPKGNGEPQVSCFLNSRVTVNKVLGVHSFNPTTYGQNSDTAPNCYVCKLEKLHTIFKAYYKTLYRITGKATNFKWGQYKKKSLETTSKLISVHATLTNTKPDDTLIVDIIFIGGSVTGHTS